MSNLKIVKPHTPAQKTTQTTLDTWEVTYTKMKTWKIPQFQRALRVNAKVLELSEKIKVDGGVIPGVITIGVIDGDTYLVDGQHRREAFALSECGVGYCDVRVLHFTDLADMAQEFVDLNSKLVAFKPDDILKGLESSYETLSKIRKRCPYVGYDQIRRSATGPVVSMSSVCRSWFGSQTETPRNGGISAPQLGKTMTMEEADQLVKFLECAYSAWGREPNYSRLWLTLNLTLCMWLFRNLVITVYSPKSPRLSTEVFSKCLMSLSADSTYIDWLLGRGFNNRDLAPAYARIKTIFGRRIEQETGRKPLLPAPTWATSR